MKNFISLTIIFFVLTFSAFGEKSPNIDELQQISQLPSEIPQRVGAIAYDGKIFWFPIYLDNARYATFKPQNQEWKYSDSEIQHQAISKLSQPFNSAAGMVFVGKQLWLSGSYGQSFGCIDTENWHIEKSYRQMVRPDLKETNSQSYSDMTFDGENLWIAWHLFDYELPNREVQQLLKIKPETGEIIQKFSLPIGTRNDGTHGLTFDGKNLWHIKGKTLSVINLDGQLIVQYKLNKLNRPSGIVWDGSSLWIVEFSGKLWNLPFTNL